VTLALLLAVAVSQQPLGPEIKAEVARYVAAVNGGGAARVAELYLRGTDASTLGDGHITWTDSWHQSKLVECAELPKAWGLFALHYTYAAGEGPDWGWRTIFSQRPTGELVLQMTNLTPWGEEARAVRMIFTPKP